MVRNKSKTDRCRIVWQKTNGVCAHCGRPASSKSRTVDHYVPRACGGGYDIRNLMPLCKECNLHRENFDIDPYEFYKYAPMDIITQCIEYEKAFSSSRRSMGGTEY
jgi:hypothetical protein